MTQVRPERFNTLTIDSKPADRDVRLVVDGRLLEELVTEAERQVGARHPGDYAWLPADIAYLPSGHLLGHPTSDPNWGDDWGRYGFSPGAVALAGCECGSVGCNPLVVTIEAGAGIVRWCDFQSRAAERLDVGPFVFNRRRYVAALRRGP